jgi:hypothetical protein
LLRALRTMQFSYWTQRVKSPLGTKALKESRAIERKRLLVSIFPVSTREKRLRANGPTVSWKLPAKKDDTPTRDCV